MEEGSICIQLKAAENSLRSIIDFLMREAHGMDWIDEIGIPDEKIDKWKGRQRSDRSRLPDGGVDERLIFYSDFPEVINIVLDNWSVFENVFDRDRTRMEVFLGELKRFRNPDAHHRQLLPHQDSLVSGITGYIRNAIIRYRSNREDASAYFPRIESMIDNLGTSWTAMSGEIQHVNTKKKLRPGDTLEFIITAFDPEGATLEYQITFNRVSSPWVPDNHFIYTIKEGDIGLSQCFNFNIRSPREYHASGSTDDWIEFCYDILPPKAE